MLVSSELPDDAPDPPTRRVEPAIVAEVVQDVVVVVSSRTSFIVCCLSAEPIVDLNVDAQYERCPRWSWPAAPLLAVALPT